MYLIQELIPQTAVDIAFKCNILHEETENLLIVKGNILEIYDIKTNKNGNINLIIRHIEEFYSNIIAISSFKFIDGKECLILCFHNIKISIIQYDNIDKKMKLCYIYDMDIEINTEFVKERALLCSNSVKSSCFLLFNDNISLFSFKESQSNSSSFDLINEQINRYSLNLSQTELKIHKIIDATFMTNYGNDTVGILYEPLSTHINLLSSRSDTLKFTAIIIDRDADILIPIWTINNLPFDSFKLLPICPSLGNLKD
uniref:Cleavage and polyadenylation specificity factor subunit 1 (Trinotate prediction) n=1 Tax=Henneguya salminicola TaxID=69463 RepID=A0A6G3MIB1_HENSL